MRSDSDECSVFQFLPKSQDEDKKNKKRKSIKIRSHKSPAWFHTKGDTICNTRTPFLSDSLELNASAFVYRVTSSIHIPRRLPRSKQKRKKVKKQKGKKIRKQVKEKGEDSLSATEGFSFFYLPLVRRKMLERRKKYLEDRMRYEENEGREYW